MLYLRVLGSLEAAFNGVPLDLGGPRQRAVLALLLTKRGDTISTDRMIEDLWRGQPPSKAMASLHAYVSNLRNRLEPGRLPRSPSTVLLSTPPGYALRVSATSVDAWRFEEALRAARSTTPALSVELLTEALTWWSGPAYAPFADEVWAAAEAARLDELRVRGRELLTERVIQCGDPDDAVTSAELLTRENPLREEGWRLLATALWASGRQPDALAALQRHRRMLKEDLGLLQGPELEKLEQAILNHQTEKLREVMAPDEQPLTTGQIAAASLPRSEGGAAGLPRPHTHRRPGSTAAGQSILGRERELARITALLPPSADDSQVLCLLGDAGMGKSALLAAAMTQAQARGIRVLHMRGSEQERPLALAGLHQILRDIMQRADDLPSRQRASLLGALGLEDTPNPPEKLFLCLATLTLLSAHAAGKPLLIVIDDAHWVDSMSLEAMAFVARRLEGEPIALLIGARGTRPPDELDSELPQLVLGPLPHQASGALLDRQPSTLTPELRRMVLDHAVGNPLALIELTKACNDHSGPNREWATNSLPLTDRLVRVFTGQLKELPPATREALLLAAASGSPDVSALPHSTAAPDLWAPAESIGLVALSAGLIHFRHPLIRSAVYYAASPAARRAAHQTLAWIPGTNADRQAWHLAAASTGPDEKVASTLVAAAERALLRGAAAEALAALERAAQLSPTAEAQARRLSRAALTAVLCDRAAHAVELATQVPALTRNPAVLAETSMLAGWAASSANRQTDAINFLLPTAQELASSAPDTALEALAIAAGAVYHSGSTAHRQKLLDVLSAVDQRGRQLNHHRLFALGAVSPFSLRGPVMAALHRSIEVTRPSLIENTLLGNLALVFDEPDLAIRLMESTETLLRNPGQGEISVAVAALGWARLDRGKWLAAEAAAVRASEIAHENTLGLATVWAACLTATLDALRGETDTARQKAKEALSGSDPAETRSVAVRAWWAIGAAAQADGDHEEAYRNFRLLFTTDGQPFHYHLSVYGVAELAASARHIGRNDEARVVLSHMRRQLANITSARVTLLLLRATALLAEPHEAEQYYVAALHDPTGKTWPYERARTRLDYAEWLLAQHRADEAATPFAQALAAFEELGARPWALRARAGLQACGVTTTSSASAYLQGLTVQQRHIIRLAIDGLPDGEIAQQMLLSQRTVEHHLSQAFSTLRIRDREQLRDLLERGLSGD